MFEEQEKTGLDQDVPEARKYLSEDIYDSLGRLLLVKGMPLTDSVMEILAKRNIAIGKAKARKVQIAADTDPELEKHMLVLDEYINLLRDYASIKDSYIQFGRKLIETAIRNLRKSDPFLYSHLSAMHGYMPLIHAHAIRVTFISGITAAEYGHVKANLSEIVLGSLLHDVGRLMCPSFLNKYNKLSDDELYLVKQHSIIGSYFLKNIDLAEGIWKVAGQHHESYNGAGYPNRILGEEIHINAQIVRLADVFDALASLKAYQNPAGMQKAIGIIQDRSTMDFSPDVVEAFAKTMRN